MIKITQEIIEVVNQDLVLFVATDADYPGLECKAIYEDIAVRGLSHMIINHRYMIEHMEQLNQECNNYF